MKNALSTMMLLAAVLAVGCGTETKKNEAEAAQTDSIKPTVEVINPEWSKNATMYEVNLRQYSKEGTFKAFQPHIKRLKDMGVDILWFMPIHPIGEKERKGSLGSYYSVKDYKAVSPEFGTLDDFKAVVKEAHGLGMKVIIDWVANHAAHDNVWVAEHPDWFTKDSAGKFIPPVADWSDVIDLNYNNADMRKEMTESLTYWIKEADIDGFRCDVAEMVPTDYWATIRPELNKLKPVFLLAEGERPELHTSGFDATYTWSTFHVMNMVAGGKMTVASLDSVIALNLKKFGADAVRLYFTTNHDENTWNGTEYERMGPARDAFSALTFVLPGMPLIYSGQEAKLNKRLKFFDKDVISWGNYPLNDFYKTLTSLKSRNQALHFTTDASYERLTSPAEVFAFRRSKGNNQVVYIANLSTKNVTFTPQSDLEGQNPFTQKAVTLKKGESLPLKAWEFLIIEK